MEERRKRAEEAVRLEKEKKRRAAEKEELRRQAEAKAAKEAEEARLKEEARKAEEEERRRAREQYEREAAAAEERKRAEEAYREWEREERLKREREARILARWRLYEVPHIQGELTFKNIVWPVLVQPVDLSGLTRGAVDYFLFSEAHSKTRNTDQRMRDALKRWHPDKLALLESRVKPSDWLLIQQAFNDITVHLNALKSTYA